VRRGPARADDANFLLVALGPHHEHEASTDRSDRQEPIFVVGVGVVENLEVIDPRRE